MPRDRTQHLRAVHDAPGTERTQFDIGAGQVRGGCRAAPREGTHLVPGKAVGQHAALHARQHRRQVLLRNSVA